jgi:hypothetical protein
VGKGEPPPDVPFAEPIMGMDFGSLPVLQACSSSPGTLPAWTNSSSSGETPEPCLWPWHQTTR